MKQKLLLIATILLAVCICGCQAKQEEKPEPIQGMQNPIIGGFEDVEDREITEQLRKI